MKNINIAENILTLRKKNNVTQEQLAKAINVSSQAISKWETNTCQPDTQTMPLIADFFRVSIDYLYYGENVTYDDIYQKNMQKVKSYPQMSKEAYEEALKIFASAHHGISYGNLIAPDQLMYDSPAHISNENGVSLLSGKGYGAIITKEFFKNINRKTAEFSGHILEALSDYNRFLVVMAIVSMSDISFSEMQEKLNMEPEVLRSAMDVLIQKNLVEEKVSKHKVLGTTYEINPDYYSCICILIATMEMQRYSGEEICCCAGFGDYPINFD